MKLHRTKTDSFLFLEIFALGLRGPLERLPNVNFKYNFLQVSKHVDIFEILFETVFLNEFWKNKFCWLVMHW